MSATECLWDMLILKSDMRVDELITALQKLPPAAVIPWQHILKIENEQSFTHLCSHGCLAGQCAICK